MICPKCQSNNLYVIETRGNENENIRVRKCADCGSRYYTSEVFIESQYGKVHINKYRPHNQIKGNKYGTET